jgi:hypothetical protein
VEFVLEKCGHTILKKCSDKEPKCTYKCIDRLECGHACEQNCHKNDDPEHEKVVFVFKNVLYHNRYNNDFDIL